MSDWGKAVAMNFFSHLKKKKTHVSIVTRIARSDFPSQSGNKLLLLLSNTSKITCRACILFLFKSFMIRIAICHSKLYAFATYIFLFCQFCLVSICNWNENINTESINSFGNTFFLHRYYVIETESLEMHVQMCTVLCIKSK